MNQPSEKEYRAQIKRAGIILNRTNECIREWLASGELAGLSLPEIEAAINRNLARHTRAGQAEARKRLRLARGAEVIQR